MDEAINYRAMLAYVRVEASKALYDPRCTPEQRATLLLTLQGYGIDILRRPVTKDGAAALRELAFVMEMLASALTDDVGNAEN